MISHYLLIAEKPLSLIPALGHQSQAEGQGEERGGREESWYSSSSNLQMAISFLKGPTFPPSASIAGGTIDI